MGLDALRDALPAWARDIRLNIETIARSQVLGEERLWSTMLAAAVAARNPYVVREVEEEAQPHLSREMLEAVYSASSVMAMNTVYYRARHLLAQAGIKAYEERTPRLRMQALKPGGSIPQADVELWCLACSAVNGCASCLAGHEQSLSASGVGEEEVHEALRIAAVVNAAAAVLDVVHLPEPVRT